MGETRSMRRFALLIGAMKSGTTSLFEYLSKHEEIAGCRLKEPNFFSDEERWRGGLDAYRRLWDWRPDRHRVALEASTSYSMRPWIEGVAGRVAALESVEFRILYLMRDPVERVQSHLSHLATRRGSPRAVGEADFHHAVEVSRYAMQLDPWARRWPRSSILPLLYEEMRSAPAAVVQRTVAFLGVAPIRAAENPGGSELGRAFNTREEMAADQVLSDLLARTPWLRFLQGRVPKGALRLVRRAIGRRASHAIDLTEEQRERASERLREDVLRLRDEWGVDTSGWGVEV